MSQPDGIVSMIIVIQHYLFYDQIVMQRIKSHFFLYSNFVAVNREDADNCILVKYTVLYLQQRQSI